MCAQINCGSDHTAQLITRGSASVQEIAFVLKGLGYSAFADQGWPVKNTEDSTCPVGAASPGAEANDRPAKKSHKNSVVTSDAQTNLGYIADMKSIFAVKGMTCGACVAIIERFLNQVPGVKYVSVALLAETAEVLYDGKLTDWKALLLAIAMAGYGGTHIYTANTSSVEYSRRLFAIDMANGSANQSAFNCTTVVAHTMGLISLNWVNDGSLGMDKYEGGPITTSPHEDAQFAQSIVHPGPASAAAYGSLERRYSFTGMSPEVFGALPVDIVINPKDASAHALHGIDMSSIKSTEVVLQAVFDSQLVGLRTIYETMVSLNPNFCVRLLPKQVRT